VCSQLRGPLTLASYVTARHVAAQKGCETRRKAVKPLCERKKNAACGPRAEARCDGLSAGPAQKFQTIRQVP